ncbi:NB-ARC domain-containing disease resistance protein [Euphorbia peplus]|nr:NB-ARC domain-containing disease resistance protein [Euphorbia peplus]
MSVIGEAILSASLQLLLERLSSPQFLQYAAAGQHHVFSEFKKWEKTLLKLHAVLDDAEHKQLTNHFVKIWLSELRDLAYDVEDILDEFATKEPWTTSKLNKFGSFFSSFFPSSTMFKVRMGSKMKRISTRLKEISDEKNDLELRENLECRSSKVRSKLQSTCLVDEARVFGREMDKESVLELCMRDYDRKIGVIAIIGMAGVGKTTLAQLVYNDHTVEDCFDLKVWACVSDDFDVLSLTKSILESVTQRKVNVSTNLNLLQGRLQDMLTDKKFLIILDDVWNENYHSWDVLCSPFTSGAPGSRIVVTTRNRGVSSISGSVATYYLKELSYESCLPLFTQLALGSSNFDSHPDLKAIGEGIVKKCKGLPLVAKTLGSLLHTKVNQDDWEDVFHSRIWDLPEEHTGIIPALRLSYHYLPSHLKQCFAYCSIFPKGYEFGKEELVLLWMAEGFLQQLKGTKKMENLGAKCFDDLLSRSFFQQSTIVNSRFVMHDLINDLAQYVAGEFCFRLEDGLETMQRARHVSYSRYRSDIFKRFKVLHKAQSVRTFLPLPVHMTGSSHGFYMRKNLLCQLLSKLRRLRVLSLNGYCISELPNAINKLKHLWYLDLSNTLIRTLPESVNALCSLQTLILYNCGALSKLPAGIVKLINLHHLDITNTDQLQELPSGIGKLINLRTLSKFMVRESSGLRMTELNDMLHLQGKLAITGLHNVEDIIDACEANLQSKHDLQELNMEWSNKVELQSGRDHRREMNVLEMLQPHKNLRVLKIEFYGGIEFPSWIGHPLFSKLVRLTLKSCRTCSFLPSLGKLPSLEDLLIEDMQNVTSVGLEFYAEDSPPSLSRP